MRLLSNPVGRTRKTSFPLSSNSKASLYSDFQTNTNSCEHIRSIRHFTVKALAIHLDREYREWLVENITWQLGDSLHRNLANGNCPWLGEAGNSNEYNVCKTDSPYFLASLPSLALCFQPRSTPFVWLLARTWISKNTDCFSVYIWAGVCRECSAVTGRMKCDKCRRCSQCSELSRRFYEERLMINLVSVSSVWSTVDVELVVLVQEVKVTGA